MIVYASVGNSDDKLTQREWSKFLEELLEEVPALARHVHGVWYSAPDSSYQNACVCFDIDADDVADMRSLLADLRARHQQDSIAWAVAPETEFI